MATHWMQQRRKWEAGGNRHVHLGSDRHHFNDPGLTLRMIMMMMNRCSALLVMKILNDR